MLVNTSFNVRGEPIVCHVRDAYRCFMNSDMDALIIENFILLKSDQPPWAEPVERPAVEKSPWRTLKQVWMKTTFPIRWLVANVTLCLIFLLIVAPIGMVWRRFERDLFQPIDRHSMSYWKPRGPNHSPSSYFKQY
jgi:hypothetical protein